LTEKNADEEKQASDEELAPEGDSPVAEVTTDEAEAAAPDTTGEDADSADDDDADFDRDGQTETPPAPVRERRIRERSPSRRTIIRENRRRRSSARKSRKRTIYGVLGGIVAGALILGITLPSFSHLLTPTQDGDTEGDAATVGTPIATQASSVLADGETYDSYPSVPPTSGPSYAAGVEWGAYEEQQANEAVVRNLEQGAIVANYNLTDEAQIVDLTAYLESQPGYPGCYVLQPHTGVAAGQVTLTSWGWMESFTGVDRPGMQEFVIDHRNDAPLFQGPTCGADTTLPDTFGTGHEG
jgi:hypothetical protein